MQAENAGRTAPGDAARGCGPVRGLPAVLSSVALMYVNLDIGLLYLTWG